MGTRALTRRFAAAAAGTCLALGAVVGLTGGTASAQQPRSEEPSVAELCATHYQASTVSAAAHLVRDLRVAARDSGVPVALHGLRCGQVAGVATRSSSTKAHRQHAAHGRAAAQATVTASPPAKHSGGQPTEHGSGKRTGQQSGTRATGGRSAAHTQRSHAGAHDNGRHRGHREHANSGRHKGHHYAHGHQHG